MEVTGIKDSANHMIVAKPESTQDFGITDNAEFFHVLSSALYSDPQLAAIRETMCNAWDAHRMIGIEHTKPIEVLLEDRNIEIKDYGPGIPKEKIKEIYLTYGASTKTNDDNQTGGFGLGCKSPFAVTETFNVINCNGGYKTEYIASKCDNKTGKPNFIELYSIPCDETGVTVKFTFNNNTSYSSIHQDILYISYTSGLPALLNKELKEYIKYDELKNNFTFVNKSRISKYSNTYFIKYGDVIYPLDLTKFAIDTNQIKPLFTLANRAFLYSRSNYYGLNKSCFIIKAEPGTITLTPSRESIQYTQKTINNINELFIEFNSIKINEKIRLNSNKYDKQIAKNFVTKDGYFKPIIQRPHIYNSNSDTISDIEDFAKINSELLFEASSDFNYKTIINTFINANNDKKKYFGSLRVLSKIKNSKKQKISVCERIFSKKVNELKTLCKKLNSDYSINMIRKGYSSLAYEPIDTESGNSRYNNYKWDDIESQLVRASRIVILTNSLRRLNNLSFAPESFINFYNNIDHIITINLPKNKKNSQELLKKLEENNFYVINFTEYNDWEPEPVKKVYEKKPKSPIGLNKLSIIKDNYNSYNKFDHIVNNRKPENNTLDFEAVTTIRKDNSTGTYCLLDDFNRETSGYIFRAYNDKIGYAYSTTQKESYIKKYNKSELKDFIFNDLREIYDNNHNIKLIISYISNLIGRGNYRNYGFEPYTIYTNILNHSKLSDDFKLFEEELNIDEYKLILLFSLRNELDISLIDIKNDDSKLVKFFESTKKLEVFNIDKLLKHDQPTIKKLVSLVLS